MSSSELMTGTIPPVPDPGLIVVPGSSAVPVYSSRVQKGIANNFDNFLNLINKIGDMCINNEICVLFLTATFVCIGVRLLRKVIGSFGRGR